MNFQEEEQEHQMELEGSSHNEVQSANNQDKLSNDEDFEESQESGENQSSSYSYSDITDDNSDQENKAENIGKQKDADYIDEDSDEQKVIYEGVFDDDFDTSGQWRSVRDIENFDNNFEQMMPPPLSDRFLNLGAIPQQLVENPTPLGCCRLYYTDIVINDLATESNLYKEQICTNLRTQGKSLKKYITRYLQTNITFNDILVYHCIFLSLSLIPVTNINCIWSENPFLRLAISSLITRDKFRYIDKFFHLQDNTIALKDDFLYKIQSFINIVNSKSQELWIPNLGLCIDEAVEPFKGRSKLVQYHPQKPQKWGMRLQVLTCAVSAFTLNIEICKGKLEEGENKLERLVLRMTNLYSDLGYFLAMDNLYTMVNLFLQLSQRQFRAVGTVRANRLRITKEQKQKMHFDQLPPGGHVSIIKQNLHVLFWKPLQNSDKLVQTINNFLGLSFDPHNQVENRIQEALQQQKINCDGKLKPVVIEIYNKFTHGTDRRNQLLESFRIKKIFKWWKSLYLGLFQNIIINSWKIYEQLIQKSIEHRKYRDILLDQLIKWVNNESYQKFFNNQQKLSDPFKEALRHQSYEKQLENDDQQINNNTSNAKARKKKNIERNKRVCVVCGIRTYQYCRACIDKKGKNKGLHEKCVERHQKDTVKKFQNPFRNN